MSTDEEKELLYNALCCMIPYGTIAEIDYMLGNTKKHTKDTISPLWLFSLCRNEDVVIKPYLRPMNEMTDEEAEEFENLSYSVSDFTENITYVKPIGDMSDWLNKNHFDYRGLIPMGLALKASKDMY